MMKRTLCTLALWLLPVALSAQPAPITATNVKTTDATATSVCVGCPSGSTTPAANGGVTTATVVLKDATPSSTTNKLYNVGGALYFNGLSLATGSSISGTTGTVPKFTGATTLGDSIIVISGANVNVGSGTLTAGTFNGSGSALSLIPTSAVSSGNFVATVASGTGITSSVTSGNAAATTITLNNTAVTPSTYGSATAISVFTVDQQGRITNATTATPQLTLTSTYFSSLSGVNLTGVALLGSANTFTANQAISGSLRVGSGTTANNANILFYRDTAATQRWNLGVRQDVGGANEDFKLLRYDTAAAFLDIPLQVSAAAGAITMSPTATLALNTSPIGLRVNPTFVEFSVGSHSVITNLQLDASVTAGTASVTTTIQLYIPNAMAAVGATNYSLVVGGGTSLFQGFTSATTGLSTDGTDPGAGNFRVSGTSALVGNVTLTGVVLGSAGAVGAPTYSFSADTDTGIYTTAANYLQIAAGGRYTAGFGASSSVTGAPPELYMPGGLLGTAKGAPTIAITANTSGSGAAGTLNLWSKTPAENFIWADSSAAPGVLRIATAPPVEDGGTTSDRSGTIVGTQSSTRDTKNILGLTAITPAAALNALVTAPVFDFTYKGNHAYGDTVFHGLTIDESPWIGMDPDAAHPNGRSFNAPTVNGYTVLAIQELERRLSMLEAK